MTTLRLPADTVETATQQLVGATDWRDGASLRRYRDAAAPRTFTLRRRGTRGELALYTREFEDKTARDWTPPGAGAAIKVQVGDSLQGTPVGGNAFDIQLQLFELRSSD